MEENNVIMPCKAMYISFINKKFPLYIRLLVIAGLSYLTIAYWTERPLAVRIVGLVLYIFSFLGVVWYSSNGLYISKKGKNIFIPDFRVKKFDINNLKRISIVFYEWENRKYSATIRFVSKDGRVFEKNYSDHFRTLLRGQIFVRSVYTINRKKVQRICDKTVDDTLFDVTVVSLGSKIIYQKVNKDAY